MRIGAFQKRMEIVPIFVNKCLNLLIDMLISNGKLPNKCIDNRFNNFSQILIPQILIHKLLLTVLYRISRQQVRKRLRKRKRIWLENLLYFSHVGVLVLPLDFPFSVDLTFRFGLCIVSFLNGFASGSALEVSFHFCACNLALDHFVF